MSTTLHQQDFNKLVAEIPHGSCNMVLQGFGMISTKKMGLYIITNVLPGMYKHKEVAFAWHFHQKDIHCYTEKRFDEQVEWFKSINIQSLQKVCGDTEYTAKFKVDGEFKTCRITTEIWYNEDTNGLSPIALLLGQIGSTGFHFCKVKFD